jgi:hypothetical protein
MRDGLDDGAAADTGEDNHATALECPPVSFAIVFEQPKTTALTKVRRGSAASSHLDEAMEKA